MKEFQIFNSYECEKIKAIEKNIKNSYVGFIYILEYGKNIKIGYSKNPVTRIKSLKTQAEYGNFKLGNVVISKPHTNYRENEKLLHEYFKQHRISGTELFSMTLKQALSDFPDDLKFLDESEKLTQKQEQGLEDLKKFVAEFFGDVPLEIKEYKGQRVVTFKDIDTIHNRPAGTAKKRFNDNRKRFIEGEDFFLVKPTDGQKEEFRHFGFEIPNRGIILLTESGYLMLVKSFTDDLSWNVQRQLVKTYFKVSEITTSYNDMLLQIIENQKSIERMIDMHEKNSVSRADSIMKTLFDMSSNVIVTGFEFIYNKFFK